MRKSLLVLAALVAPSALSAQITATLPVTCNAARTICTPATPIVNPDGTNIAAGGTGGDASAANQQSQITQETLFNTRLGDISAPTAGTVNARLGQVVSTLGTPFQAGGAISNTAFGIAGTLPAYASTPTFNVGTTGGLALETTQTAGNTKLDTLHADLIAPTPAGSAIIGKVGIDQTTPGTTNAVVARGDVASGATDAGNPVKVGAIYQATAPTLTDLQRGNLQVDTRANLKTTLVGSDGTTNVGATRALSADGATASQTTLSVAASGFVFNGTSFDRARSAASATGTSGVGIPAAGVMGFDGTSYRQVDTALALGDANNGAFSLSVSPQVFDGTQYNRARGDMNGTWSVTKGGSNLATAQVSVATTATLVAAARTGRSRLVITQSAAGPCYYGPTSAVSATTGARLVAAGASKVYQYAGSLYGLCPGGAVTTDVDEEY